MTFMTSCLRCKHSNQEHGPNGCIHHNCGCRNFVKDEAENTKWSNESITMNYLMRPYDDAVKLILAKGVRKSNRTGIDTLSIFGIQSRYFINERFPLLTKRKMSPKSIFAELLWVISGSTNVYDLKGLGSNIWDSWIDSGFEQEHTFVPGSLGPVYGFELRYFGGKYGVGDKELPDYGTNGFDQWYHMVNRLKSHPDCRRNLFSLWNPLDIYKSKLPPCHYTFQLYTDGNRLSGMMTQRSADYPIGVPANIQFYSAIIYLLARECGLEPWELVHNTGDSHIYVNQIDAVKEYLERPLGESPRLTILDGLDILNKNPVKEDVNKFVISDYNPADKITIPVAV